MTNPVFFTSPGALAGVSPGSSFVLDGPEARHAITVRRLAVGEPIDLADGRGTRISGVVATADARELTVECSAATVEPEPAVSLVLVQALAKGDRDELAIETATELGIDGVIPWQSERSIVRWRADRAAKAHAKWESVVTAAAKQARRAWIPGVESMVDTAGLARRAAEADLAVILHEDAVRPFRSVLEDWSSRKEMPPRGEILLIVGPEGGIAAREVTKLCDAGAATALLGRHVLRSSTAGPAAVVVANDILRRW